MTLQLNASPNPTSENEQPLADLFLIFGLKPDTLRKYSSIHTVSNVDNKKEEITNVKPQILDSYPKDIKKEDHQYICSLEMVHLLATTGLNRFASLKTIESKK